jgi:tRNA threonylcarbamoyladenosine biosynthesis protein TsaB
MKLLAIETSSDVGTVALLVDESLEQQRIATPREQTERILPMIDELLATAGVPLEELDGIAFGRGPGSFTGLRVAAAVAQGLGLAVNLPLLPVSSLAAMAQGRWRTEGQERSLVCIDARMGEVFWGAFEVHEGLAELLGAEHLSEPDAVAWTGAGIWGALGSGFDVYAKLLAPIVAAAGSVQPACQPSAADLLPQALADLRGGRTRPAEEATPVYLRDETAWQK